MAALTVRTALASDSGQHTATAIGTAIHSGVRPHLLRRLALLGRRRAAELGVPL
ncbi:hypothetical protein [Nocardia amamiensis]|uniref:hypothetical protein n=1 Tax=Nocardia amamiensis TaxID=404578 RepID=UPI0033CC63B2